MSSKKEVKVPTFDVLSFYAVDSDLEEKGAVMKLREDPTGEAFFLVRPFPNPDYHRKLAEVYQQHAEIFKAGGEEADRLDKDLTAAIMAETVLVGGGGMARDVDKEYRVECLKNSRIRERVVMFATNISNYRIKDEEIEKK